MTEAVRSRARFDPKIGRARQSAVLAIDDALPARPAPTLKARVAETQRAAQRGNRIEVNFDRQQYKIAVVRM